MKTILFLIFFASTIFSQVQQEWSVRYDGPLNIWDEARDLAIDDNGNIYVVGTLSWNAPSYGPSNFATIKYNPNGQQQWIKIYNGPNDEREFAYAIANDNQGNVYITGKSQITSGYNDYVTIKYNTDGIEQWVNRYDGPSGTDDEPLAIAVDNQGNMFVTGGSVSSGFNFDIATIKYDTNGNVKWVRRYDGPTANYDFPYALAVDNSGNIIVTGESKGTNSDQDFITIKYDTNGNELWVQRFNGSGNNFDIAWNLTVDSDDNVYVVGESRIGSVREFTTIKYSSSGTELWHRSYVGPAGGMNSASAVGVDISNNVYVTGESWNGANADIVTIKYDSSGQQQWAVRYNGPGNGYDYSSSLAVDQTGVYITGQSNGGAVTLSDYITIKYDFDGNELWLERYNGENGGDESRAIAVDENGNVYVTGRSLGSATNYDFVTIKYSQQASDVEATDNMTAEDFYLLQNYPNPFNPTTTIQYSMPQRGNVTLKVYDVIGNEIATLVNEEKERGVYSVNFDASELASGIYFYCLKAGSFIEAKKMILIK